MPRKSGFKRPRLASSRKSKKNVEGQEEDIVFEPEDDESSIQGKKKVRWTGEEDPNEENANSDEDISPPSKVCLTASCQNGRVGCSYYDPIKCTIYVLEDAQESVHFDLTKMMLEQCNPDIVYTSSKADDAFITILQDHMEASGGTFQIRPYKEFLPAKGRDRILSLQLLSELHVAESDAHPSSDSDAHSEVRNAYDFMKRRREENGDPTMKRWNAAIRLSNYASLESASLCMSSIGALIDHLNRERAMADLDEIDIDMLDVRGIETVTLDQVMHINADALFSLQVFENESHASIHSTQTKEGLSLFGILDTTRTILGRSMLRTWLLRPALSISVINARHDAVEVFMRAENIVAVNAMNTHLKGIKNVPKILGAMRKGKTSTSEWQGLVKFTYHSAMLCEALSEIHHTSDIEIIQKLKTALDIRVFKEMGSAVNETIDWEESAMAGRVCVRPHIDEELDNRKHIYHGIDAVLSKVAEKICETVPADYATSLNVVYFPQLGFLICVPMSDTWKTEAGVQVIDGWSFQASYFLQSTYLDLIGGEYANWSSTRAHVYFKSKEMHDMDAHIGDLHPAIVDREIEIIQELQDRIMVYDQAMSHACDVCAELDCLISFSEASRAYDYRRPQMVEEPIIDIVNGRHPLQEQVVDTFVPNNARLVSGAGIGSNFQGFDNERGYGEDEVTGVWNSVVLCTGANACGKSVYLKQVALIQYMAQIGCFVPAERATLGVVDKIFTRIQTRESVSRVQSAFMIDLNQVSLALRNCSVRSLILLDEFGKGTLSADGAGLFCGVIKHLLNRGADCPKVIAATHFHEVFRPEFLDPDAVPITFLHMQVMFSSNGELLERDDPDDEKDGEGNDENRRVAPGERITYLYRVARGLELDSHAAHCAELFGLPRRLVQRAQYVSKLVSMHETGKLLDEDMTEEELQDLADAEDVCRRFLAWDLESEDARTQTGVKATLKKILGRIEEQAE